MIELHKGPRRFKDLRLATGLTDMGLNKVLKNMVKKGNEIQKVIHEGKPAYALTKEGEKAYAGIWFLLNTLSEMKEGHGKYAYGYVPLQTEDEEELYYWPTVAHMAVDRSVGRQFNPVVPDTDLIDFQTFVFKRIIQNAKKNRGKVVIGIEIDYSDFYKALRNNSLEKWGLGVPA